MTTAPSRTTKPAATAPTKSVGRVPLVRRRIAWTWIVLSSLAIVAYSVTPYLLRPLEALAEDGGGGLAGHYVEQPPLVQVAFYLHIVGGGIALALAPFQFWAGLRNRFPAVHRWVGRTAIGGMFLGGTAALVIAPFNDAGLNGLFGFGALGVLWIAVALAGFRAIRRGDVRAHRAWMMRAFALTYSAVTLRLWLGVLIFGQLPFQTGDFDFGAVFENAYGAVPFLAWIPNLIVAEWLIARRGLPTLRIVDRSQRAERVSPSSA